MSNFNQLPSENIAVVGVIDPDAYTAGTHSSGWVDASKFHNFMVIVMAGDLGSSATLDAKIQHASDSSGTGAEDVTGKAITQLKQTGTDSNKQVIINLKPEDLVGSSLSYKEGTSSYFRLVMTISEDTSDAGAIILGVNPRYTPTSSLDLDSVVEIK